MIYRTILVHADLSRHAEARWRLAVGLARAHGAQLVGIAMTGVSRDIFPTGYHERPGTLGSSCFAPQYENAGRALARFEEVAAEARVPYDTRLVCDRVEDGLALQARFTDLVVISQDDPDESVADMPVRLPDFVVLNCARPVLVVPINAPDAGKPEGAAQAATPRANPHRVLVAWDGSREASSALAAALPLLRQATAVHIASLTEPGLDDSECLRQHGELGAYLGRHHVTPNFLVRPAARDSGRALLDLASELGSGLLVMGCYGHGRLRELCLGGASRTVLAETRIPLLLAH